MINRFFLGGGQLSECGMLDLPNFGLLIYVKIALYTTVAPAAFDTREGALFGRHRSTALLFPVGQPCRA